MTTDGKQFPTSRNPLYTTTDAIANHFGTAAPHPLTRVHLWRDDDGWHVEPDDSQLSTLVPWDDEYAPQSDRDARHLLRSLADEVA